MKVYKIPDNLRAVIFDIDSTLYTNQAYAFEQVDCQVREFAKTRGITADEARKMVSEYRKKYAAEHDGKKVSLGNIFVDFGVSIEQSVEWRKSLQEPSVYLSKDKKLYEELEILSKKYKLICVTNNPVFVAKKTLQALGVMEFFPDVVGLDTCYKSKPAREPFELAVKLLGCDFCECIAIGDRYDMDVALPLEMGMGGIVVSGVEEIYGINRVFI